MDAFKIVTIVGVLFVTTATLCWLVTTEESVHPVFALLLLLVGILVTGLWGFSAIDAD
ncbi:MAG: hypothetical protein Kow00121_17900 [Elainellaceae cyanobacterium]